MKKLLKIGLRIKDVFKTVLTELKRDLKSIPNKKSISSLDLNSSKSMKNHKFEPVGYAMGSGRYRCSECGATRIDDEPPHHFPTWNNVSMDCDEAKRQIVQYENEERFRKINIKLS